MIEDLLLPQQPLDKTSLAAARSAMEENDRL